MWRQGDILVDRIVEIPVGARRLKHLVIERSPTTGHEHKIREKRSGRLFEMDNENYLEVLAEQSSLVHPEHDTIVLLQGCYRIWRQREFSEFGTRVVLD